MILDLQERIKKNSAANSQSGCWDWVKGKNKDGYGKVKYAQRDLSAHRAAWLAFRGPIAPGMLVCHKCDNPSCVNPDHLFLGSPQDNMDDKMAKGRWRGGPQFWEKGKCGAVHHNAKLDERKVVQVLAMFREGRAAVDIAKQFGVSDTVVIRIRENKAWKHVQRVH